MKSSFKTLLGFGLLTVTTAHAMDIVFVGNSFTHGNISPTMTYNAAAITDLNGTGYGGIPGIFKKLSVEGGYSNVNVYIEAISGQRLSQHWTDRASVLSRSWDWAILQEYSTRTLTSYNDGNANVPLFRQNVQDFRDLFKVYNPGAAVLLYETWARPDLVPSPYATLQAMQNELQTAYSQAATDFGLTGWAKVGDTFMQAVTSGVGYDAKNNTSPPAGAVNLWASDNYHPSVHGAYLSALTFYSKILGGDPRTLPTGAGSAAAGLGISATVAASLQQVVYAVTPPSAPAIVAQPTSQLAFPGSNVTFSVTATGGNLTYQWRKNGVNISGATSSALTLTNVQTTDAGAYTAVVTTFSGSTLTSNVANLTVTSNSTTSTFLIDFGDPTVTTTNPDSTGKYWNNLTVATTVGAQVSPLITATNVSRPGTAVSITKAFNGYNASGINASTVYPATAQRDTFYITGSATAKASVRLSGLKPNGKYTLKIFASRSGTDATRTSRYTIAGIPSVYLDAANNSTTTATLAAVQPTAASNLTLDVESYNAAGVVQGFAYLGVIEVTEQVPAESNIHGGTWAAKGVVTSTATWSNFYQQPTGIPTSTTYTASFWLKGSGKVTARVLAPGWGTTLASQQFTATSTWTLCTLPTFSTGANTSLVMAFSDSGATSGTFYLDDCFLGISGGTNKLTNPGFESGATGWTSDGYVTILQNP